jgi:phasin
MADQKGTSGGGIPQSIREMAESSVAQAKQAFEQFMEATHRTFETAEKSAQAAQVSTRELRTRAVDFAEANVAAAFDLAQRLVNAKDTQEIVSLQQEFLSRQLERMKQQMQELGGQAASEITAAGKANKPKL